MHSTASDKFNFCLFFVVVDSDSDELIAKNDRKAIKTKFANFNEAFEVQYNAQRKYAVPDSDLRSQVFHSFHSLHQFNLYIAV
jgi:hypothetical protein